MNKMIIGIAIVCIMVLNVGAAKADSTKMGPVVDDYYAGQTGQCVNSLADQCRDCAGKGGLTYCSTGCIQVIQNCGATIDRAKAATHGPTYKWVKAQINKAVKGLVSKDEFDRVIGELQAELTEVKENLKHNWDDHDAIRGEIQDRAEAQVITDGTQNRRLDALENEDKKQDEKIAALSDEVMFNLGPMFFGAPHVLVLGASAGLQLRIAEHIAVTGDLGLGYAFDKDVAITAKGGVVFYVSDNFGLGPTAIFAKESFDDEGDVEIGGGVDLRVRAGGHFFASGAIGLGAEGVLQNVGIRPDGEALTDREFGLAVMGQVTLGAEF